MRRRGRTRAHAGGTRRQGPANGEELEVTIERIGHRGDGIADGQGGRLYVPLTVPGDRVRVRTEQRLGDGFMAASLELLFPGPDRGTPPCPHFTACGGCALQHLTDGRYAHWKRDQLLQSLARAGLDDCDVADLVRTPPESRRRATFTVLRGPGVNDPVVLGFNARHSHDIVDLRSCAVVEPRIASLLSNLKQLLKRLLDPRQRTQVSVSWLEGGLDVVLQWPDEPDLTMRQALAEFASAADLARLSWKGAANGLVEPIVQRRPLGTVFGRTFVPVPPGAFLQASVPAEAALVRAASAPLASAKIAADLFAGLGTFTFALASAGVKVHAVEGDSIALQALARAARNSPRISWENRDLFINPLQPTELRRFDAVVFDPPRAGARVQAEQLANSAVPSVIAVSCNPNSFVRDARTLVNGGYRLQHITPVDQFVWSTHLELVAVFSR